MSGVLRALHTAGVCVLFMAIGPTLILLNKHIMQDLGFPYPMCLSGMGLLVSSVAAYVLVGCGYVTLSPQREIEGANWYKRVLPVGIAYAATLAFGNWVYMLLDVGFIQMLKSFTPVVVIFILYITGVEHPSTPIICSIVVISIGTAVACSFSPHISLIGVFVMLMSEIAEAVRLVLTQFLLKDLKFGVIEGQYVLSPASTCCLFFASAFTEIPSIIKDGGWKSICNNPWMFISASVLGLVVNYLTYFVIQVTSSLTLKVLGTLRNILVIFAGVLFYSERITLNEALGYTVALIGFAG
jgi:drug/metabolite transporter (DMT)-like permease